MSRATRTFITAAAALLLALLLPKSMHAASITVGTITINSYKAVYEDKDTKGFVRMLASFNLNADYAKSCIANLKPEWIQLTSISKDIDGLTPKPNRPFIDPREGQNIGGGQKGDNTPFYDITVNDFADVLDPKKWLRDGSGKYIADKSGGSLANAPFTFTADTLLVVNLGVSDSTGVTVLGILGGFEWGYQFTKDKKVILDPMKVTQLTDSRALRDKFTTALEKDFTALEKGFPGYVMGNLAEYCPGMDTPTITLANPEPAAVISFSTGLVVMFGLAWWQHRQSSA
jgi:hypothetical protein